MTKEQILKEFAIFAVPSGGIGAWIIDGANDIIFERIGAIDKNPLSAVQLNQLLVLGHEAPVSDGFFNYYWLLAPKQHPYDVTRLTGYDSTWTRSTHIVSVAHLKWGLYRLYVDALLYFGNVRSAFRDLRNRPVEELQAFFGLRLFDTDAIRKRGPALPLISIPRDNRYLISEMACKSYGDFPETPSDLHNALVSAYQNSARRGQPRITVKELLQGGLGGGEQARQQEFLFSADEILGETVSSEEELKEKYAAISESFFNARKAALTNTSYYLSMVNDLDVYVATSMRNRDDFRNMAEVCERIFADARLRELNLRYFDPTLSAAGGHEDKGLIECLMVKCAKVLILCAGERDSYGKDAEAAMALSLGKPVIFYCDREQRSRFYREIHPLSRLIDFNTGVAVGAMVTDRIEEVSELLVRLFENRMEYEMEQPKLGYLRLVEALTKSVVRLQTNDRLVAETFWNHYHGGVLRG